MESDNDEWAGHALVTLLNMGLVTRKQAKKACEDCDNIHAKVDIVKQFCNVQKAFSYACPCGMSHYYYNVSVALKS